MTPTLLCILYWTILVIVIIFAFFPPTWPIGVRFAPALALFIIIGLKIFKTPIQ